MSTGLLAIGEKTARAFTVHRSPFTVHRSAFGGETRERFRMGTSISESSIRFAISICIAERRTVNANIDSNWDSK